VTDMTLGEMIAAHSQPAPPPYVAPPPAPVIPTNAAEAVARLNELKGTAEWRDQYLSGSSSHAKELRALEAVINNGDHPDVDRAMAGISEPGGIQSSNHVEMIATAEMLRELGASEGVIRQTLNNDPVTQQEHDAVARLKRAKMADAEWSKKLFAGDRSVRLEMVLADIVLSSRIKSEAA